MEKHLYQVTESGEYSVTSSTQNTFEVMVSDVTDVTITTPKNSEGLIVLLVSGEGQLNLNFKLEDNGQWTYLWVNQSDAALTVNETLTIGTNVQLKANYGELSNGNHQKETLVHFVGPDSRVDLRSATVAASKLIWSMTALHEAKRTYAMLQNYAIALKNSEFSLDVAGHILNGYSGSETHQISRVLNLDPNIKSTVYPKLLIDENDVAASHAASVGQPNMEHVYYLQSRGLTRNEVMALIVLGYLLPIVSEIEEDTIKEELTELIKAKVNSQSLA